MSRLLLGALFLCLSSTVARGQTVVLESDLSGSAETPPTASTGVGHAIGSFDSITGMLSVSGTFSGFPATVAHVHRGAAGVAGPIVFALSIPTATSVSGAAVLSAADVTNLLDDALYVNIHSAAFPGGEIRGQLRFTRNFQSEATGALETPPNGSTATASARYSLNQPAGTLTYGVEFQGLVPTVAHIHTGAAGVAGPILFPLTQTGPTTFSGTTPALSNASLIALATEGLYLNIHTAAFPGGEIRDQLHIGYLNADTDSLSVTRGGLQTLHLAAGPAQTGELYFLVGSLSGTTPGLPVDGVILPLNFDTYLLSTITNPNSPILAPSLGFLGAGGVATSVFTLPPGAVPVLAGSTVHHAALVFDLPGVGAAKIATQPVACTFVP
jgi:hypothetical protein